MASAHVCSAVRDADFSPHVDKHLAFARHSRSERQLLRELDRAFTAAEEQAAASASSSSWKSCPQRSRKAEMRRAARRNSVGSVTSSIGSVTSVESRGLDNEGEWINFLSGLDGAIQRAVVAPSSSSSPSRQAKTESKQTQQRQRQQQRRRRASLGRQTTATAAAATSGGSSHSPRISGITDAADFSSASASASSAPSSAPCIYPDSRPKSALRKGKFHRGERLFVDAFLSRSSSRRTFTAERQPEKLRFDTPTVYHLSHEGRLERTEISWTAVDIESSTSFVSLPKIRTSATTYSRMKRRQMQEMMMFQHRMEQRRRKGAASSGRRRARVPMRRNSLSSVAPAVVADFRQ